MIIRLMTSQDENQLQKIFEDDNMIYDKTNIKKFRETENAYAFVVRNEKEIFGFAYGYSLVRLDGKTMFYLHSIGVLPEFQNMGYGRKLMDFIINFSKEKGFSEVFVITDKGNIPACKLYEKVGFENDIENEIVYVLDLLKE